MKENSPLKKMGLLRKQSSTMAAQENSSSPLKAFGQGPSLQKRGSAKMMLTKGTASVEDRQSVASESPLKASPLKKQMRMFEAHESPSKLISELIKVKSAQSEVPTEQAKTVFGKIKATNLLKSRKTCEKRQLNISELAEVD